MRMPLRNRRRKGNAFVEIALAFSVLMPVMGGTYQFGYAFYQYNNVESAMRNAARYAAYRTYNGTGSTPPSAFTTAVRNMAVYGSPAPAQGAPKIANIDPNNISVIMTFTSGVPSRVQVKLNSFTVNTIFKTYTMNGKPTVTFPYIGRWDPMVL
jgi:Flp pilus assembly protein TadG